MITNVNICTKKDYTTLKIIAFYVNIAEKKNSILILIYAKNARQIGDTLQMKDFIRAKVTLVHIIQKNMDYGGNVKKQKHGKNNINLLQKLQACRNEKMRNLKEGQK